jgi:asparagine synthase (glutamine-hydrolysing)
MALVLKDKNIITYTVGWTENDPELARAKKVADKLGLKNKQIIFGDIELLEIRRLLEEQLGMSLNIKQHILTYLICEQAKKDGIKVLLSGNAADEIFYGYDSSKMSKLLWRFPNYKVKTYGNIGEEIDNLCDSPLFIDRSQWMGLIFENEHSLTIAPDLGGMAQTMEMRSPFMDVELMEWAFNLPLKHKVTIFENKKIMRNFIRNKLGKEFLYKNKIGFGNGVKK